MKQTINLGGIGQILIQTINILMMFIFKIMVQLTNQYTKAYQLIFQDYLWHLRIFHQNNIYYQQLFGLILSTKAMSEIMFKILI